MMGDSPVFSFSAALARAILWLFTAKSGLVCLALVLLFFLCFRLGKAARERFLLARAAGAKPGFRDAASASFAELSAIFAFAAANVPTLLMSLAIFSAILGVSASVAKIDEFLGLQERSREMSIVLRNLERRYRCIDVECLSYRDDRTTLRLSYYSGAGDASGNPAIAGSQEMTLPGRDIYLDALVLNFDYSEISGGRRVNLAIPSRAFSEKLAERDGIDLRCEDDRGVPYQFLRDEADIYGLGKKTWEERVSELMATVRDDKMAREGGIVRSVYGNAVHRVMSPGQRYTVWIEQSGGITMREERKF